VVIFPANQLTLTGVAFCNNEVGHPRPTQCKNP